MALLEFARGLVGVTHEATPITMAVDPDDRSGGRIPTEGDPLECVVLDLPGTEARALNLDLPAKLRRVFFDPTADGVPPVDTEDRIRVRDELINVLSVRRIETGGFAGSIVEGTVINE